MTDNSLIKKGILLGILLFSSNSYSLELIRFDTNESIKRLSSSEHKVDFFKLSNYFTAQPNGVVCGPTSASIILNALKLEDNNIPMTDLSLELKAHLPQKWDPRFKRYTPQNFFNKNTDKVKTRSQVFGEPINGKKDFGLQLRQLHKMMLAHGVKSKIRVVSQEFRDDLIRKELINNLSNADDYILINYARKFLGQKGGGHISPLVAYDQKSDSFLIMDVNPNKDQWVWVKAKDLFNSMRTFDTIENRGYLLLSK